MEKKTINSVVTVYISVGIAVVIRGFCIGRIFCEICT